MPVKTGKIIVFHLFNLTRYRSILVGATCPCDGITLEGSDQEHCWQVQSRDEGTWDAADDSCISVGGHLGLPLDSNFATILSFALKESTLPVLTGVVAGNTEIPLIGAMCQSNVFYQMIDNTTGLLSNTPTMNATCSYIKSSSPGLVFDSCQIDANVLCDRPLEKEDFCSIMANCTSTTTMLSSATAISSTTSISSITSNNTSLTSSTTQSYSSSITAGDTTSSTTSKVGQSTTIGSTTSGGSGGNGVSTTVPTYPTTTCQCPGNSVVTTTTLKTTTSSGAGSGSCTQQNGCLKYQWKIFGMCVDWRAMLALLGILLGLFLCCCFCHCCMHACMFCTPQRKEKVFEPWIPVLPNFETLIGRYHNNLLFFIVRDPILPNRSVIAPVPLLVPPQKMDYDVEKSDVVVLPPPTIQPEPVYITVPEKHESVYGFHTKEIIHVMPERPLTREVGTMTDMEPELPPFMPVPAQAPVMKRKKVVKKPKKMFIPATADPMNSIEEDVASEVAIDIPDSPGARSVAPLGDVVDPAPMIPLNFSRNPKPMMPEPKIQDDIPMARPTGQSSVPLPPPPAQQWKPNKPSDNDEFDPSGLRSPPIPPAGNPNNGTPKRMTFSPIADESEEETGARIPSPPREPKASAGRPGNKRGSNLSPDSASEPRPTLKNQRLNEMPSPTPAANAPVPAKSPVASGGASNNPFANLGGPSPAPAGDGGAGAGRAPGDDVGMRAARGRLGGAVRGGGGGGEAPNAWKPWAKGGARR
ncbi:CBN-CWP-5 protein [Caenorhabditis brenneri]|uniref:CBN-CWP-5 protein n=1 Tax=Caenorhabditis brenneri TaxID=135651 RepID=G0MBL1_CAEBE|nr:CBN-CWP-5 protein [Caenorhabditis brenneri]